MCEGYSSFFAIFFLWGLDWWVHVTATESGDDHMPMILRRIVCSSTEIWHSHRHSIHRWFRVRIAPELISTIPYVKLPK
jgi:hypothetical protein